MLLVSEFLNVKEFEKIKVCTFCKGKPGRLKRFVSHNGKRTDFICTFCISKIGRLRIQQILEDLPFHQVHTSFFKNKGVAQ